MEQYQYLIFCYQTTVCGLKIKNKHFKLLKRVQFENCLPWICNDFREPFQGNAFDINSVPCGQPTTPSHLVWDPKLHEEIAVHYYFASKQFHTDRLVVCRGCIYDLLHQMSPDITFSCCFGSLDPIPLNLIPFPSIHVEHHYSVEK